MRQIRPAAREQKETLPISGYTSLGLILAAIVQIPSCTRLRPELTKNGMEPLILNINAVMTTTTPVLPLCQTLRRRWSISQHAFGQHVDFVGEPNYQPEQDFVGPVQYVCSYEVSIGYIPARGLPVFDRFPGLPELNGLVCDHRYHRPGPWRRRCRWQFGIR